MLDEALRDLERALRASPQDAGAARKLLQALRRAGRVEPDAPPEAIEPVANPGIAKGDLVLVARRSRPRASFVWRDEMDAAIGEVARVARLHRDGLGAFLEGEPRLLPRWQGDPVVGRSFGFGSLVKVP